MPDIFNMTDTWGDGGTVFTAIKMDVADNASDAASLLMDLLVGGVQKFVIDKDGNIDVVGVIAGYVDTTTAQTIAGAKTFTSDIDIEAVDPDLGFQETGSDTLARIINSGGTMYIQNEEVGGGGVGTGAGVIKITGRNSVELALLELKATLVDMTSDLDVGGVLEVTGTVDALGVLNVTGILNADGGIAGVKSKIGGTYANLGDPTVEEMALFHGQFANNLRHVAPDILEESTDGTAWSPSTRGTVDEVGDLMRGEGDGTSFEAIPALGAGIEGHYRMTWTEPSYRFLNQLYVYCNPQNNDVEFIIEGNHNTNGWEVIQSGNATGWPAHVHMPHSEFRLTDGGDSGYYSQVRLTLSVASSNTNAVDLYGLEWFGGYPAGKRNIESSDRDGNVFFPEAVGGLAGVYVGGSAAANLISEYEMGSFSPRITDGVNDDATYTVSEGIYTKVGRIVTCSGRVTISSLGSVSGALELHGLPFSNLNNTNAKAGVLVPDASSIAIVAGTHPSGIVIDYSAYAELSVWDGTSGAADMTSTQFTDDGSIQFTITYQVEE